MKSAYGYLFALAFALTFAGCSTATGVGGLFGPTQMITQDGTGCMIPSVPSGAVAPPNPAPFPTVYKMQHMCEGANCGDFLMPIYASTPAPVCTEHIVTASGGTTLGDVGKWAWATALGIFAMVK